MEWRYLAGKRSDTATLATMVCSHLVAGDILLLSGDLAAGKTAFTKDLGRAAGYQGTITSPTFTLANFYDCASFTLLHVDVYRISSVAEYLDLGLTDFEDSSVTVVEWGEMLRPLYPEALEIDIRLSVDDEKRLFTLSGGTERWRESLTQIRRGHLRGLE